MITIEWRLELFDFKVRLPDDSHVCVSDISGPWNAVARAALKGLEELSSELEIQIPISKSAQMDEVGKIGNKRLEMAKHIMKRRFAKEVSLSLNRAE